MGWAQPLMLVGTGLTAFVIWRRDGAPTSTDGWVAFVIVSIVIGGVAGFVLGGLISMVAR